MAQYGQRGGAIPSQQISAPLPNRPAAGTTFGAILIAEDDPFFRKILQTTLLSWGYEVLAVEDGKKAWKILEQPNAPDLLILDWMMPGLDGIELCRQIRARQGDRYPYVLLLSGKDEKKDVIEALDAGADDYLAKPFDSGELRARLRAGYRILQLQNDLLHARDALRYQATHDDLTGLWSRGTTLHLLGRELERGRRSATPTGVLMIDVDHFKKVNDVHGHLVGDVVIKEVANRVVHAVRSYDFVGRYGGEEFLAVLSKCTMEELKVVAERVRQAVAQSPVSAEHVSLAVSVSIGGAVMADGAAQTELLSAADIALYAAKRTGRNRVVVDDSLSHSPESNSQHPDQPETLRT